MAVLDVIDECYSNIDNKEIVVGIFFDLQKAFDTVNHNILVIKLQYYGIRGLMLEWLQSYLSMRQQFTIVNGVRSSLKVNDCGVPQGSVLGPLLFLLYINDLPSCVPEAKLKLFADDTNLFLADTNLTRLEYTANICLKNMEQWFIANKLSLNVDKTYYSIFCGRKLFDVNRSLNLFMCNQRLSRVSSCKFLGIVIDEKLTWSLHVNHIKTKIFKFIGIFYKIRSWIPVECLKMLYFSFIYPHLLYGIEIYANCSHTTLQSLHVLNNRILRVLLNKPVRSPVNELYINFDTLPLHLLFEKQVLIFVHKCLFNNQVLPEIFHNYFNRRYMIHEHNTRKNQI